MTRIAFVLDGPGNIVRICADEPVEVYIICPHAPLDRVYRWDSLKVGQDAVGKEIDGWPVGDRDHLPSRH